jgi:tetratricopeptide (TPR) repeat protein
MRQMGYYEEALRDFDRSIALDESERVASGNERGLALSSLGRYAEAIECYHEARVETPDHYTLYNIAVAVHRWKGPRNAKPQIKAARDRLMALLDTDARSSAVYGLAGLEALEGKADQALRHLQEVVSFDEQVAAWARHDVAWLDLREDPRFQTLVEAEETK